MPANPNAVVIGYGNAGRAFHCYLIHLAPQLTLHGVCARKAEVRERAAAEQGCKTYESLAQVLADDAVDLVVLATPNSTHGDLAVQALEAGKAVVTDKPMALSLEEADRMIAASEKPGAMLSVFMNRRWDGDYLTARQLLDTGMLGAPRRVEMWWGKFGMWGGWRGQRAMGGGKLYDLGAHLADQICQLMPTAAKKVFAHLQYDSAETDVESDATVTITFEDGAVAVLHTSSVVAAPKPRFFINGSDATFVKYGLDPQEEAMKAGDIDSASEDPANFGVVHDGKDQQTIDTLAGRWRSYYENVGDALRGDAELAVTAQSVRPSIALLDAAFRSAEAGRAIDLND